MNTWVFFALLAAAFFTGYASGQLDHSRADKATASAKCEPVK